MGEQGTAQSGCCWCCLQEAKLFVLNEHDLTSKEKDKASHDSGTVGGHHPARLHLRQFTQATQTQPWLNTMLLLLLLLRG